MHNRIKLHAFFFGKNNERKSFDGIMLRDDPVLGAHGLFIGR